MLRQACAGHPEWVAPLAHDELETDPPFLSSRVYREISFRDSGCGLRSLVVNPVNEVNSVNPANSAPILCNALENGD